jgi:hypothetical protein
MGLFGLHKKQMCKHDCAKCNLEINVFTGFICIICMDGEYKHKVYSYEK